MTARWRLLRHHGVGAAEGLALDEALAAGYDREQQPPHDATLRLYTYQDTAALVGRFQSLEAEVDLAGCAERGAAVNRRPTGGGAIIMGSAQLGVALATRAPAALRGRELLGAFADGIVAGLAELGIHAEFHGKNDVTVGRRKIAGLGLYVRDGGGLLLHASILADLDVELMLSLLRIPAAKLAPVGHRPGAGLPASRAAVEARVTTVSRLLDTSRDGAAIAEAIGTGLAAHFEARLLPGETTGGETDLAAQLRLQRYDDPGWLTEVAPAPDTTGSCELRTRAGLLRFYATAHNDVLKSLLIATDASVLPAGLVELESALRWRRLEATALSSTVAAQTALVAGLTGAGEDPAVVIDSIVTAVLTAARPRPAPEEQAAAQPVRPEGSCYFPDLHDAR